MRSQSPVRGTVYARVRDGRAGAQSVADAPLGEEVAGTIRVDLELATQAAHGDPEIGGIRAVRIGPDAVEELLGAARRGRPRRPAPGAAAPRSG